MSYSLVRNLTITNAKENLCEFFGITELTDELSEFIVQQNSKYDHTLKYEFNLKLEDKIISFYKNQIKTKCNQEIYVLSKRIYSKINPNVYFHLIFATKNLQGLAAMKNSIIKYDDSFIKIEEDFAHKNKLEFDINMDLFNVLQSFNQYTYNDFLDDIYLNFPQSASLKEIATHFLEKTPLPYRYGNDENSIYGYLNKILSSKLCSKTKGPLNKLTKDSHKIIFEFNLTQLKIQKLLNDNNNIQMTLF